MLRRVHEILSRKFPKWVFDDRIEPLDWSILPVEMKREIVKHADFQTRCRLRQCSVRDRQIVDSLQINLPFVRIESDKTYVSVMFCESETKILKIKLAKRKIRLRKRFVMVISDNIYGKNSKQFYPNQDFEVVLESLFHALSLLNVSITTLNLALKWPHDTVTKYLDTHYRQQYGPRRKTKILCSGLEFLVAQVQFLPVDETRLFNDLVTHYESGRMMFAGKKYTIAPLGHIADVGITSFLKPSLLNCNLGALIAGIIWRINTELDHYYIPGLKVPELQEYCDRFEGRITKHRELQLLHIPVPHDPKKLLVRISKCGVVIQKLRNEDVVRIEHGKCILEWMCSTCDKSLASWYFRKTNGIPDQQIE